MKSYLRRALYNVKHLIKEVDTALTSIREYEDNVWILKEPLYGSDSLFTAQDEDVIRRARNITLSSARGMSAVTGAICHANGKIPGLFGGILTLSAGMMVESIPHLTHECVLVACAQTP